jgi:hypothetical protein
LLRQDPRPPSQRVSGFLHSSPTLAPTHTQGLGRGSGAQLPHQQGFVTLGGNRKPHQRCQATATAPAPLRRKQYCACAKRACDYLTRAREAGPAASEGGARMTDGGGATSDPPLPYLGISFLYPVTTALQCRRLWYFYSTIFLESS